MFGYNMFNIIQFIFPLMFLLILTLFVVTLFKAIGEWTSNNQSPRLTVEALVVGRRAKVSGYSGGSGRRNSTAYYVTFEVASGDRMELRLSGSEYGMLAEGDRGQLSFQGTRYLGFERRID